MCGSFVTPRYLDLALSNVLPSVSARLRGEQPVIDIPTAKRYVVLLVDGLGWHQLEEFADHADQLAQGLEGAARLTCSVPSTTATSLTSLGCGAPPGEHGIVGYTFHEPSVARVINALSWVGGPEDVGAVVQTKTQFQALAASGIDSAAVMLKRFSGTALTQLAFGGAGHRPIDNESDQERVAGLVVDALEQSQVVYVYERMLDHDGHGFGVGSWQWLDRLGVVDDLVGLLARSIPADTCLLVTGDHGMINVSPDSRIVVEEVAKLLGFDALGGEPRFRHVYADDPGGVAKAWSAQLGERAVVLRKEEAIAAGWFGPTVTEVSSARIGDVVVAMTDDFALMSQATPGEFGLVGMHGSLTAAEMEVPLLMLGGLC